MSELTDAINNGKSIIKATRITEDECNDLISQLIANRQHIKSLEREVEELLGN